MNIPPDNKSVVTPESSKKDDLLPTLRDFLASVTTACGVYQMYDSHHRLLYVGKARNLKKRLSSYFRKNIVSVRIATLVAQIHHIEVMVTRNENEALLLENQLIKTHHPRYNILLRDDKSYPFIVLTHHAWPRLLSLRGTRNEKNRDQYYGPYPSGLAVRETLKLLQKIFLLRTCDDSFFAHRTRPCLLYQIKKCSAPCVNYITPEAYAASVNYVKLFLTGKSQEVVQKLIDIMMQASANQAYEQAARLRDQIAHLRHIQMQQSVMIGQGEVDVFVVVMRAEFVAVEVLSVRGGSVIASQTFYPKIPLDYSKDEILSAFIPQYYYDRSLPQEIVIGQRCTDQNWLVQALASAQDKKVRLTVAVRGQKQQWLALAIRNAEQALTVKIASRSHYQQRLLALQQLLQLPELPRRMECFDISHSGGEATVASCVVFDDKGSLKSAYRRFNIENVSAGDDYAAIYQAIHRRYQKIQAGEETLPDILFIDGGKGQLHQAETALQALTIPPVSIVAVAKGPERKPGREQLFLAGQSEPLVIAEDSPALHLIQQIRDEAHRFALHGHQRRRDKKRRMSLLENIPGIGKQRRQRLLQHLGGWQEVRKATVEELQRISGISPILAQRIYDFLRRSS